MRILSRYIKFCPKTGKPVKALKKWIIPLFSLLSLIWVLVRLVPKPQRAAYPCMKVAIPFASSLVLYVAGVLSSAVIFRKALSQVVRSRFGTASILLFGGMAVLLMTTTLHQKQGYAGNLIPAEYEDPLGPNSPIGEARGVLPGRVVWMHNPDATNEHCVPWEFGDGYFMEKNCDQQVVDEMLSRAILEVTGAESEEEGWEAIFTYYNVNHGKGEVGYTDGEKIFIKINAVHAWSTNPDLSIMDNDAYGNVDTSPQVILAVLRQLINRGGVPEEAISIGDPYTNIFKHLYEKLHAEFPEVHYMSREDHANRDQLKLTNSAEIRFSDRGSVLDVETDQFYDCTIDADYVLSLPAMKGHRGGGVTFFAKNHFGTNTRSSASHMHRGLHKGTGDPVRGEYRSYRVFVDLMAYEHLGGKTLIYIGDFLWGTSMEHDPPVKFRSSPFNDDYSSSILVSLDPVAISSVALDIYQEEFKVLDESVYPPRYTYVRFPAVDDYLHQAASSEWWPEGMVYDPEGDGIPVESLGVHEHWNNATDRQYSGNLGSGEGIELLYMNTRETPTRLEQLPVNENFMRVSLEQYPALLHLTFGEAIQDDLSVEIYSITGQLMQNEQIALPHLTEHVRPILLNSMKPGFYVVHIRTGGVEASRGFILP